MICEKCMKNSATVRYAEVVDGKVIHQQLCAACLAARQRESRGFSLEVPRPKRPQESARPRHPRAPEKRCGTCFISLARILETGTVGCASCYASFGTEIESILEGLQRSLAHRGKSFAPDDTRAGLAAQLQAKRSLLRTVLQDERYEEAARLRDEIAKLEMTAHSPEAEHGRTD